MKRKRKKREGQEFENIEIWTDIGEHCPNLVAKFSFVKKTPVHYPFEKFRTMPFKLINKIWEKYGIARVFDATVSTQIPIVECWYPPNTVRVGSPAEMKKVSGMLFGHLSPEQRFDKDDSDLLMTFLGSTFMRVIAETVSRERDYQIYMNSVSPIQIPVPDN